MAEIFCGRIEVNAHTNDYLESLNDLNVILHVAAQRLLKLEQTLHIHVMPLSRKRGRLTKVAQLVLSLLHTEELSANSGISLGNFALLYCNLQLKMFSN